MAASLLVCPPTIWLRPFGALTGGDMSWCVVVVRRRSITDEAEANDANGERADDEWGTEEAEEDRPGLDEEEEGEEDGEEEALVVSSKGASMAALSAKSFRLCTRRSIIAVQCLYT
jgi:hypothetical protein